MEVYPGTPVNVHVTRGPEHEPVVGAFVELQRDGKVVTPSEKKEKRPSVSTSPVRSWLRTNTDGWARGAIGLGEGHVRLASGNWQETHEIEVKSGDPIQVDFHRTWLGERHASGQLTQDGKAYHPPSTLVALAWMARTPGGPLQFEPKISPDGAVTVDFDAAGLSLLLIDRENHLSGFAQMGEKDAIFEVAMRPTAVYSGRLLDDAENPLSGRTLRLTLRDNRDAEAIAPATTDGEGRFTFADVPSKVALQPHVERRSQADVELLSNQENRWFSPGEKQDEVLETYRVNERVDPIPVDTTSDRASLADSVGHTCQTARLGRMLGLAILRGDDSKAVTQLAGQIEDSDRSHAVLSYLTLDVPADRLRREADALAKYRWPLPEAGEIVLAVLDGQQQTLATKRIDSRDEAAALKAADELLSTHLPPRLDAPTLIAESRQAAHASGRRVLVVEGGPRCGPCFRLARWIDEHHALLEKDFVIVKLMQALDGNLEKALSELHRTEGRIPWMAITEPDGKLLVTSDGPLGNIGMPSSIEQVRHFREMLEKTRRHLTQGELDQLVDSLRAPKPAATAPAKAN